MVSVLVLALYVLGVALHLGRRFARARCWERAQAFPAWVNAPDAPRLIIIDTPAGADVVDLEQHRGAAT